MKILLVANMYPSLQYPHYGVFVQNSEKILKQMENIEVKNVVIHKTNSKIVRIMFYLFFYIKIIFYVGSRKYDVLYGHFISHIAIPIWLLKKINKKIKIVVNVHGNDIVPDSKKDEKWTPIVKKVIPLIDRFVVPSTYFEEIMIHEYDIDKQTITVFPSGGVNRQVFYLKNKTDLYKKYNLDSNKKYIGYVSRIEKNKGWDIFLEAVQLLKTKNDIRCIVVGDGEENKLYNKMVKELGVEKMIIKFNLLSQQQISDLFNILDVFCFPTYRKSDSLGLVGMEAMACGSIVVASDKYGPSTYMMDTVNGFTIDALRPEQLHKAILKVLTLSEEKKDEIRLQAMNTVERYEQKNVSHVLIKLFESLR